MIVRLLSWPLIGRKINDPVRPSPVARGSGHEATACQHLTNGVGTLAMIRAVSKHHRPLNSKIYIIYLNTCTNIFQRHTNYISLWSYIYVPGVHNVEIIKE